MFHYEEIFLVRSVHKSYFILEKLNKIYFRVVTT